MDRQEAVTANTPSTAQWANAAQATATNLANVITLANELRAALVEKGMIVGTE